MADVPIDFCRLGWKIFSQGFEREAFQFVERHSRINLKKLERIVKAFQVSSELEGALIEGSGHLKREFAEEESGIEDRNAGFPFGQELAVVVDNSVGHGE